MATVLDKVELDWPEHYAKSELAKAVSGVNQAIDSAVCAAGVRPGPVPRAVGVCVF